MVAWLPSGTPYYVLHMVLRGVKGDYRIKIRDGGRAGRIGAGAIRLPGSPAYASGLFLFRFF